MINQEYKNSKKWHRCPYYSNCPHRAAICKVLMPDKDCPLYKCLKKLIEENENDKN